MDISPRMRALRNMTTECLRLIRTAGKVPAEEAERCLQDLPSRIEGWLQAVRDPNPESLVAELPGLQGYSLWADTYDARPDNPVIMSEEEHIWGMIGPARGKRVLDAGCGTGRHSLRLAKEGAYVVASEPNEALLEKARRKAADGQRAIRWLDHSIETLPASLGRFDVVLCCLVLSHVADIASAIRRLAGFLADAGTMIVSDFHPFNLMIGWRTGFFHDGRRYVVPNYLHLPSSYFSGMTAAGLSVVDFREVGEYPQLPDQPATIILKGCRQASQRDA